MDHRSSIINHRSSRIWHPTSGFWLQLLAVASNFQPPNSNFQSRSSWPGTYVFHGNDVKTRIAGYQWISRRCWNALALLWAYRCSFSARCMDRWRRLCQDVMYRMRTRRRTSVTDRKQMKKVTEECIRPLWLLQPFKLAAWARSPNQKREVGSQKHVYRWSMIRLPASGSQLPSRSLASFSESLPHCRTAWARFDATDVLYLMTPTCGQRQKRTTNNNATRS